MGFECLGIFPGDFRMFRREGVVDGVQGVRRVIELGAMRGEVGRRRRNVEDEEKKRGGNVPSKRQSRPILGAARKAASDEGGMG